MYQPVYPSGIYKQETPPFSPSPFVPACCPKATEELQADGELKRRICGACRCSRECYQRWARTTFYGMMWSFEHFRRPDHAFRLSSRGLNDAAITKAEKKAHRKLRDLGFEYGCVREWASPGCDRHEHGLLMTNGKKLANGWLTEIWRSCVPEASFLPCYSAQIDDLESLAAYMVKLRKSWFVVPPPCFKGNVFVRSRGFLGGQVKKLYRESAAAYWASKSKTQG